MSIGTAESDNQNSVLRKVGTTESLSSAKRHYGELVQFFQPG